MNAPVKTKDSSLSDAAICRRNGWRRGTRIIGKENGVNNVLRITAVGDDEVLGIFLDDAYSREGLVDLTARHWRILSARTPKSRNPRFDR